jgi:hypothetical protein
MWSWRESISVGPQEKELEIGMRTLAYISGLHVNNVRLAIATLVEKHAIRVDKPHQRTGVPKYTILSFGAILQAWKTAGLQYVVWNKGRARLYATVDDPIERDLMQGDPAQYVPIEPPSTGAPIEGSGPLRFIQKNYSTTTSASASNGAPSTGSAESAVGRILSETEFRTFDRQAIETICKQSREIVPDITPEEICEVFLERARPLLQNRRIENLNGLVLSMWKNWLTPERITELRHRKQEGRELTDQDREAEMLRFREEQRARLSDPNLSEEEKQIIRKWI